MPLRGAPRPGPGVALHGSTARLGRAQDGGADQFIGTEPVSEQAGSRSPPAPFLGGGGGSAAAPGACRWQQPQWSGGPATTGVCSSGGSSGSSAQAPSRSFAAVATAALGPGPAPPQRAAVALSAAARGGGGHQMAQLRAPSLESLDGAAAARRVGSAGRSACAAHLAPGHPGSAGAPRVDSRSPPPPEVAARSQQVLTAVVRGAAATGLRRPAVTTALVHSASSQGLLAPSGLRPLSPAPGPCSTPVMGRSASLVLTTTACSDHESRNTSPSQLRASSPPHPMLCGTSPPQAALRTASPPQAVVVPQSGQTESLQHAQAAQALALVAATAAARFPKGQNPRATWPTPAMNAQLRQQPGGVAGAGGPAAQVGPAAPAALGAGMTAVSMRPGQVTSRGRR